MKVALCFYGLVGSKGQKDGKGLSLDPAFTHKYLKENIIDIEGQDCDVFIHSWSHEHKDTLIDLYSPVKHQIEKQIDFVTLAKSYVRSKIRGGLLNRLKALDEDEVEYAKRAYSRWYSNQVTIDLMSQHEAEQNFIYDAVMVLRLDVAFFVPLIFNKYDMKNFWASHWNDAENKKDNRSFNYENHHLGKGFLDFWFFSNSENMKKFSKLYDNIQAYDISPHFASYQHTHGTIGNINYTLYRWQDHEMVRRKFFESFH